MARSRAIACPICRWEIRRRPGWAAYPPDLRWPWEALDSSGSPVRVTFALLQSAARVVPISLPILATSALLALSSYKVQKLLDIDFAPSAARNWLGWIGEPAISASTRSKSLRATSSPRQLFLNHLARQ